MEENVRQNVIDQIKALEPKLLDKNVIMESSKGSNSQAKWLKPLRSAMAHASKHQDGKRGHIDLGFEVKADNTYLILIETKDSPSNANSYLSNGKLNMNEASTIHKAINGAVWYAQSIQRDSSLFNRIFAVGISGIGEAQVQEAYYVTPNKLTKMPNDFDIHDLTTRYIHNYYLTNVAHRLTPQENDELILQKVSDKLHNDIRTYSSLRSEEKAPLVAGILLALYADPNILNKLSGSDNPKLSDGYQIYSAINAFLDNKVRESGNKFDDDEKRDLLGSFAFIKNYKSLYETKAELNNHSPLWLFTISLSKIIEPLEENKDIDSLGDFYSQFVKYNNNDGNVLGIVLTPHHITRLMSKLINIKYGDNVLDPVAGSGTFLISAMAEMLKGAKNDPDYKSIKSDVMNNHLYGIELDPTIYSVAVSNMILRGDGNSNIQNADCFKRDARNINVTSNTHNGTINKILMNPPYSQGTKKNGGRPEIDFIKHALELLHEGDVLSAIVPISVFVSGGKGVNKRKFNDFRLWLINHCQLEDVITMNPITFYPTGTQTMVVVIKKTTDDNTDVRHPRTKFEFPTKLINFTNDGYHVVPKHGVVPVNNKIVKSKYKKLVDVVTGRKVIPDGNFVLNNIYLTMQNEWLFNAHYTNPNPPTTNDFKKSIADYLAFRTNMILHNRGYLFNKEDK